MTDETKPGRYQYRISEDGERRFLVDTVDDLWSCADCTDKDWVRDRLNSFTEEVEKQAKRIEEYQRLLDSLAKQRDGYGDNDIARDYQMFLDEREQKDKRIEELENNEARIKELLWHLANDSITPKGEIDNVADCVLRLVEQTREDSVRQMQLRTRIEELEYGHQQMLLILEDPDCMQLPDPFASMRSIARKALAEGGRE